MALFGSTWLEEDDNYDGSIGISGAMREFLNSEDFDMYDNGCKHEWDYTGDLPSKIACKKCGQVQS